MDTTQPITNNLTSQLPGLTSSMTDALAPVIILSVVLTAILALAYIMSMVRRWKVEKAILAMQKDIHEINQRGKESEAKRPANPLPSADSDGPLIAAEPSAPAKTTPDQAA